MDVVIPKDIVAATKMSEAQLKLEISIMLYRNLCGHYPPE